MTELPKISTVDPKDSQKVIAAMTAGFIADPLFRWVFPDAEVYLNAFPKVLTAYCGSGFADGTAYCDANFSGGCIWLAPGKQADDEAVGEICADYMDAQRLQDFAAVMEQMDQYHPHDEPLWYLPFIAVDAVGQGRGIGSALMKYALQICDEQGVRAYLESSNPQNISLYERHGFEVMGRIEVGSCPPVHPMIRDKR